MHRVSHGLNRVLHAATEVVGDELVCEDIRHLVGVLASDEADFEELVARSGTLPRIRPLLVVLAAKAAGASKVDAEIQYASELLYLALSVHDLAIGQKGGRRRRVAKRLIGRSVGWLGGNQLTLRALELVRYTPSPEVLHDMVDTLREFSEGQALAAELQGGSVPTREQWLEHADAHTGALFAFCCRAGGHVGEGERIEVGALERFGRHLGRIWHIAEDAVALRDGNDAAQHLLRRAATGRPMLPLALAADRSPAIHELWEKVIESMTVDVAAELAEMVQKTGGSHWVRETMVRESWAARKALRKLPASKYRHGLDQLAVGLMGAAR